MPYCRICEVEIEYGTLCWSCKADENDLLDDHDHWDDEKHEAELDKIKAEFDSRPIDDPELDKDIVEDWEIYDLCDDDWDDDDE